MTPPVNKTEMPAWKRHDVLNLLAGNEKIGVELGVAEGIFSERMVSSGRFDTFIGIDMYADMHDTAQYKRALARTGLFSSYKLLRMRFDEAIDLFSDGSLDFIYVDGYAHTGEEGGETIFEWFRKLKVGGVMAGDDYSPEWPLVIEAVDEFARQTGFRLHITGSLENTEYCSYPSWAIVKERDVEIRTSPDMVAAGKAEALRISKIRNASPAIRKIRGMARNFFPKQLLNLIRKSKL